MSASSGATIVGAFEHPARRLPGRTLASVHAEVAFGALEDAGLGVEDVDGYFCVEPPGLGAITMAEYLGLRRLRYTDTTETGGSAAIVQLGHATAAIAQGLCRVALITQAGLPLQSVTRRQNLHYPENLIPPEVGYEECFGSHTVGLYALAARRHMYDYGTLPSDLAEIKVAAAAHAQHNPRARLRHPVTVQEVLDSPVVASPLHRLDCCVITDGGGALVVVGPEVRAQLPRSGARVLSVAEAPKHLGHGPPDLTVTGAAWSGPRAFSSAGLTPADVDYASIYDSFTITVLTTLEDLGFCAQGDGGRFVRDGALQAPFGTLPFNTDGGGLCNNHPGNRGGVTKVIEAVRQVRGEAHPAVQVPGCTIALAHGTGGWISTRMGSATLLIEADPR